MKEYKVILFDLDGTLTDSSEGITKSIQYALAKFGIDEPNLQKLQKFIGPPIQDTLMQDYEFTSEKAQAGVDFYRERFKDKGMYENKLYVGIPELLKRLKDSGYVLAVATSKPTVFSKQILQYFKIDMYFDLIVGSNLDGSRSAKTEIIQFVLEQYNQYKLAEFLMVGDRMYDIIGANNNKIDSIGVTYGFGSDDELKLYNPTYIIHEVKDIEKIVSSKINQ